jgi:addiction module HigA family antidote
MHVGEILKKEFLKPLGISGYHLAKSILVPQTRISDILNKKRGVTADTAIRLSIFFKNSPEFWLNAQNRHELTEADKKYRRIYNKIKQ